MNEPIFYTKWNGLKKILKSTESDSIMVVDNYTGIMFIEHNGLDIIKSMEKHFYVNDVNYKVVSFIDGCIKIYITRVDI